ncbi:hypothetical protein JTE90_007640 [Oedothorax gibbosus]|uniref:Uncharacterized protein n=1 Tax=Oedothorax gibbosus TaxID=931172 RepID=A0AAV6TLD3_9ARAC|nr:hypothetical protein JTE90_007640 [Oedothorax gibbosus]
MPASDRLCSSNDTPGSFRETKVFGFPGGSMVAKLKLKGIDGGSPPVMGLAVKFDSTQQTLPGQDTARIDRLRALS